MKNHLLLFSIMFSLYFYGQIPGTQNIYELNNNVGIGKSNPDTKFDVLGSIQLKGSLDIFSYVWDQSYLNSRIALRSNNIKGAGIFTIGPTKTWFFGTPADDAADSFIISFDNKFEGVNSIAQKQFAKFYINSSGNIGIGNRLPQAKLHISGMVDGSFNGLIIDNLKNYGINTGVNETSRILLTLSETSHSSIDRIFGMIEAGTTSETTSINGRLSFYVRDNGNAIEKMRINSNGNVGIGTTSADEKLTVNGNVNIGGDTNANIKVRHIKGKQSSGTGIDNLYLNYDTGKKVFVGSSNNPSSFIINGNGMLGMGITNPTQKIHVVDGFLMSEGSGSNHGFTIKRDNFDTYELKHLDGGLSIYNSTDNRKELTFNGDGNVGIGTANPDSKLSVNGKIHTKEVKVDLIGWSDFVFYEDYILPSLDEVEQHIKEKGHLKDIPSAKEVEKNGIFLGEMNAKLLQKIEELTLYTIAQEKKLKEQKEKIEKEKERTTALEERLIKIEKLLKQK